MILILIFASVFLLVKSFVNQRQEVVLLHLSQEGTDTGTKNDGLRKILGLAAPISEKLMPYLKLERTKRKLISAGLPLGVGEFVSFKLLAGLFGFVCAMIIFSEKPLVMGIVTVVSFIYPDFWLSARISKRHREIRRDLPNVIDLLTLCVNAGLDFMLAVQRVNKEFKPCSLRDELSELWRETQVGRSRREALKNLAGRINLPEMTSFVRTLIQTDRMGAPMGEALRIQSEEIRMRRFQQGEAQAFKAPIKLLFPLMVFILPVVLVIVGGPVLLQFLRGGGIGF